jgi:DNA repair exonuclease SbcCD ATPase subunit
MQNNQFKKPLLQSSLIIAAAVLLVISLGSSGADNTGGGIVSLFAGIGNAILFVIGMTISIAISIVILIGIFLASVAMVDSQQASSMYANLKKNFALTVATFSNQYCNETKAAPDITEEEYQQMKQQITKLQENNSSLQTRMKEMAEGSENLESGLKFLQNENTSLKHQINELDTAVKALQSSERQIKTLFDDLSTKVEASGATQQIKDQLAELKSLQETACKEIEAMTTRLSILESDLRQQETDQQEISSGIFAYIASKEEQTLFIEKVAEAVGNDMTYAQIDKHLSKTLPAELDKIVKDHPSLTRTYIRTVRDASAA